MGKRRSSVDIVAEQELLRAELAALTEKEDWTDDDVTRSEEIPAEFEALEVERSAAVEYERRVEAIRSAALESVDLTRSANTTPATRVESGDGARALAGVAGMAGTRGPELKRNLDPYAEPELIRAGYIPAHDMVSRAMTAVEQAPAHLDDTGREHATQLIQRGGKQSGLIARHMLMTGSPEYHSQFEEYVASRGTWPGELLRAALSLTDANGGYLVPFTLDPTIILTNSGIADPIRQISTIKQIATDSWNGVTSAGVTAEWTAEGSEAADASPTFTQPSITPKKADAFVFGSYEVLADSGFATELSMLLADAKTRLEGAAFATGNTGATQPRGVVAAVAAVTASIVSSATITAFVAGDVYRVTDAMTPRYASQASWIANKTIYSLIRQMDTAGGSAFWANMGMGVPPMLLGAPAYECSTMGSVITTSANILLAGDFKQYYIVDRVGMSILYEPLVKGSNQRPTGQAGWYAFWRVGADVVDVTAFRLLQLHTTPGFTALG